MYKYKYFQALSNNSYYDIDADDDADGILDVEDVDDGDVEGVTTTEKPQDPAFLGCKLSLYTKTYLRGNNFTLDRKNSDLNATLAIEDLTKGNSKN